MSCVATLKARGLKLTPQRRLIVDVIHDSKNHLTPEEIINHVQTRMPGVNKSTVYRTLDLLEGAGCVYKSELKDGVIYHHDEEGHHHHLVCRRCGKTVSCAEDVFAPLQKSLMRKYGFRADLKHLVMTGLCSKCAGRRD